MNAFSKCANPDCAHNFTAGHGKFFRFHQFKGDGETPNAHRVCHYWLCDRCSQVLTLTYREDVGVFVANRLYRSASPGGVAA